MTKIPSSRGNIRAVDRLPSSLSPLLSVWSLRYPEQHKSLAVAEARGSGGEGEVAGGCWSVLDVLRHQENGQVL